VSARAGADPLDPQAGRSARSRVILDGTAIRRSGRRSADRVRHWRRWVITARDGAYDARGDRDHPCDDLPYDDLRSSYDGDNADRSATSCTTVGDRQRAAMGWSRAGHGRLRFGRPAVVWWLVQRPPSSAARVLQQNMIRVWNRLVIAAMGALGVALAAFAVLVVAKPTSYVALVWPVAAVVAISAAASGYLVLARPHLGAQD
jgi:hypothetical protein